MTKPPAMPEPLGWYVVNNIGMATLCADEAEAQLLAEDCDMVCPRQAPHRAVQLVALAALQSAQPAAVSDEEIEEIARGKSNHIEFARAILALRPQAVPMTVAQVKQAVRFFHASTPRGAAEWVESVVRYTEEFHRITAQGAQGEQPPAHQPTKEQ